MSVKQCRGCWHSWHSDPDNSLLWSIILCIAGLFNSICGLYPVDASSTLPPSCDQKDTCKHWQISGMSHMWSLLGTIILEKHIREEEWTQTGDHITSWSLFSNCRLMIYLCPSTSTALRLPVYHHFKVKCPKLKLRSRKRSSNAPTEGDTAMAQLPNPLPASTSI